MKYVVFPIVFIAAGFLAIAGLSAMLIGLSYLWHLAAGLEPQPAIFAAGATFIGIMLGAFGLAAARNA